MKNLIVFLAFLCAGFTVNLANAQCKTTNIYWEQLSDSVKKATIASNEVNINALNYYKGRFNLAVDKKSYQLLDTLTAEHNDGNIKALYFYLFNRACAQSDGALSEVMGDYCQNIIVNDPVYALNYFSSHNSVMTKYALFLGYELYCKEKGVSDITYNFSDFKKLINSKIGSDANLKKTFNDFNNEIERVMKNMN